MSSLRVTRTPTPAPGTYGLCRPLGWGVPWIGLGQLLQGSPSPYVHAFVVIDGDRCIEARPSGAGYASISRYWEQGPVAFSRTLLLTDTERAAVVAAATDMVGVGYSFADYLSIALHRWGLPSKALDRRIADTGHLICSQLVDLSYQLAGVHLFDDGRAPGLVSPGDLARVLIERDWANMNTGRLAR
jgi:hypothetical protein